MDADSVDVCRPRLVSPLRRRAVAVDDDTAKVQSGRTEWPATPDDWWWERQAETLQRTGLDRVRQSAKGWAGSIGTLLGIFATVAFVRGPSSITAANGNARWLAAGLIIGASVAAAIAFVIASLLTQGVPRRYSGVDGASLKRWVQERAAHAVELLWWSRGLALSAALAVVAATAIVWVSALHAKHHEQAFLVRFIDGTVTCGSLGREPGDQQDSEVLITPHHSVRLSGVASIRPVASCE
jgi:hypothetical protein